MRSRGRFAILLCALLLLGLINARSTPAQRPKGAHSYFTGDAIPSPPKQKSAWSPPATALPEKFVSATLALFDQGLADPRGCEYREVEILGGGLWGDTGTIKTHAWVLPQTNDQKGQFAVAWNGLVYPLTAVHDLADARTDIEVVIKKDEEVRARWKLEHPDFPFYRFRSAISNYGSLSSEVLLPLKACLLLRLGEIKLADQLWTAWVAGMDARTNDDRIHLQDPYLMLAVEWNWALFDRAVIAHMYADDRLSLLSATELSRIQPLVEAETDRRRITEHRKEYFSFLDPLPVLLADEQRRVSATNVQDGGETWNLQRDLKITDEHVRVAALIRDLEEVNARQWGQPGGVDLDEDEIVRGIIAQGEIAVTPLIEVIENDPRLTRSVSFSRNFHYDRHLIGVHEAAYRALVEILKTEKFGTADNHYDLLSAGMSGRRQVAADIRKYLTDFGSLAREERWYKTLKDDTASVDQWREAAAFIIQRTNENYLPPSWAFAGAHTPAPGDAFQLRGEPLRVKTDPTVSQLLIRRMNELAHRADSSWYPSMNQAVDFALALGTWDGSKSLSELQQFTKKLISNYAGTENYAVSRKSSLIGSIVYLELKRGELNDATAIPEYAAWLQAIKPAETDHQTELLFLPALRYPDAPEIQSAITHMFLDPAAAWNPLIPLSEFHSESAAKYLGVLMDFKAFREAVLKGLGDKSVVGTLTPRPASPTNKYDLKIENATAAAVVGGRNMAGTIISVARSDPQPPPLPLAPTTFRVCDVYAMKLRGFEGAPGMQLYWSEPQRDAATNSMIDFVRTHSGKFVYSSERDYKYSQ